MSPAERSAKRIEAVYDALACQAIVRANGLVRRRWDVYHSIDCRYVISCIVMGRRFCAGGERRECDLFAERAHLTQTTPRITYWSFMRDALFGAPFASQPGRRLLAAAMPGTHLHLRVVRVFP